MSEEHRPDDDQRTPGRPGREQREKMTRRAIERTLLQLSGEVGYEEARVAEVIGRSGSNLTSFYRAYAGKSACYAAAYDEASSALCARLLAPCHTESDWSAAMKRGLLELAAYTSEDPALAAGVIAEVHVAGGAALERRSEIVARLAEAVDRGHPAVAGGPPRQLRARFVVEAIEAAVVRSLADGTALRGALAGLLFVAVASYSGTSEAARQVRGWPGEA